jgi:acetoin utilization deacetylase AcuC-like enzyme
VVVALEGGYGLDNLASSAAAVTDVLLGTPPAWVPPRSSDRLETLLAAYREVHGLHWPVLRRD